MLLSVRTLLSLTIVLGLLVFGRSATAETLATVQITLTDKAELLLLRTLYLDIVHVEDNHVDLIVTPQQIEVLSTFGFKYEVTIPDMAEFFQQRLDISRDMGGYRTLDEIYLVMDSIAASYPNIVSPRQVIGTTVQGRPIYVMKISDNWAVDEDEPKVYYHAAIHAREVITPEVLIYFMKYLGQGYGINPAVTEIVNNRELYFTPCANPDGYYWNELTNPTGGGMWRKNRRDNGDGSFGIDLNRNFGYQWGYDNVGSSPNPSSQTYRGTGPFSEPEAQALRDFISSRDFVITVSYHSYSNLCVYPWGYQPIFTPDQEIFGAIGDSVKAYNNYIHGTPWALLYPTNGTTDDWGYGEQTTKNKNYAITLEVGSSSDNFWPPLSRIPSLVQENLGPNLFFARVADRVEKLKAPLPPVIYPVGEVDTSYFTLYWTHQDEDNPAVSFEVWQLADFQQLIDDLETGGDNWIEAGFTLSTVRANSGIRSYFSGTQSNLDSRLTAQNALMVESGDSLRFWTWYDIENNWDYGYVQVSSDNGLNWTNIPGSITTTSNPNGTNLGHGITGNSGGWTLAKFNLSAYVGEEVLFRFRYVSDGYVNNPGWWIDDIFPTQAFGENIQIAAAVSDTFLAITDLEIKEYYYRVRATDAEGQTSVFSSLEKATVDYGPKCTYLVGDADGSGTITISDAVYLLNYIFASGAEPTPDPVGSGDADCSDEVSVSDAVWIITHVFGGGPPPGATCSCESYLP